MLRDAGWGLGPPALPHLPVTANHTPPFGDVTKTYGVTHGDGSASVARIRASPSGVAGKLAVVVRVVTTLPAEAVRHVTTAAKSGTGLVPRRLAGTDGSLASTSPSTSTRSSPLASRSPRTSPLMCHGSGAAVTPEMAPAAPMNGETLANAVSNCRTSRLDAAAVPVAANQTPPLGDVTKTSGAAHGVGSDSRWWMKAFPPGVAGKLALVTLDTATMPAVDVSQLTTAAKSGTGLVPRRFAGTAGSLASTRCSTSMVNWPLASRSPWIDPIIQGSGAAVTPRMAPAAPMNGDVLANAVSNCRTSCREAPPEAAAGTAALRLAATSDPVISSALNGERMATSLAAGTAGVHAGQMRWKRPAGSQRR